MNGYELSRIWFDFCFENPEKIKPNHTALYFFIIEHCNRLNWKEKFGLPTSMSMEAIGMKTYKSYINTLTDLVDFGFIMMIEKSKNQYTANIIALDKKCKAKLKATTKAEPKQSIKQDQSKVSIDKPINNKTSKPIQTQSAGVCEENPNHDFKNLEVEEKEKSSAKKEKEIHDIKTSDFFQELCVYFSQTTEVMQMQAFGNLLRLYDSGKLEEFTNQTKAYMAYKKLSGEKVHRFQNFIYEWQNDDWVNKLKKERNGTEKQPEAKFNLNR